MARADGTEDVIFPVGDRIGLNPWRSRTWPSPATAQADRTDATGLSLTPLDQLKLLATARDEIGFDTVFSLMATQPRQRPLAVDVLRESLVRGLIPLTPHRFEACWASPDLPPLDIARHVVANGTLPLPSRLTQLPLLADDRADAFHLGYALCQYFGFCGHVAAQSGGDDALRHRLAQTVRRTFVTYRHINDDAFFSTWATGSSVVALPLHTFIVVVGRSLRSDYPYPVSIFSNRQFDVNRNGDFHVGTRSAATPVHFAKVCQLMRKEQRVAVISPDGVHSSDFGTARVAGTPVPIAMGGATLARLGRATLLFPRLTLTGEGVDLTVMQGPALGPDQTADEARAAYLGFLEAQLNLIVEEDPFSLPLYERLVGALSRGALSRGAAAPT